MGLPLLLTQAVEMRCTSLLALRVLSCAIDFCYCPFQGKGKQTQDSLHFSIVLHFFFPSILNSHCFYRNELTGFIHKRTLLVYLLPAEALSPTPDRFVSRSDLLFGSSVDAFFVVVLCSLAVLRNWIFSPILLPVEERRGLTVIHQAGKNCCLKG